MSVWQVERGSIQTVLDADMCIVCGTCAATCPQDAIDLVADDYQGYKIIWVDEKCVGCGICLSVCPGHTGDLYAQIANGQGESVNRLLGKSQAAYLGYSNDEKIRHAASSGGIVPELLSLALETDIVNGVVVSKMDARTLRATAIIAHSVSELYQAMGSKYNIVPIGITIKQILESSEERFAVVGLPCHILAYRNAARVNQRLAEKIVFYIGLFCGHAPYRQATQFILQREGIDWRNLRTLSYRGSGWPGGMTIKTDRDQHMIPLNYYWFTYQSCYFFTPARCLLCPDQSAELADISVGDAWLPEVMQSDSLGTSIILGRTDVGERVIAETVVANRITLHAVTVSDVIRSQRRVLAHKKRGIKARFGVFKTMRNKNAWLGVLKSLPLLTPRVPDWLSSWLIVLNARLSRSSKIYPIMLVAPKLLYRLYGLFLTLLSGAVSTEGKSS